MRDTLKTIKKSFILHYQREHSTAAVLIAGPASGPGPDPPASGWPPTVCELHHHPEPEVQVPSLSSHHNSFLSPPPFPQTQRGRRQAAPPAPDSLPTGRKRDLQEEMPETTS